MKKIFIVFTLATYALTGTLAQHTVEEFNVSDGERSFHLQMPAHEVRNMLGTPDKEIKIIREQYHRPNYFIIKYHGIEFTFFDFTHRPQIIPTIVVISFREPYKISGLNVIGLTKDKILKQYGTPIRIIEKGRNVIFQYEYDLYPFHHIVLQFEFNEAGICIKVTLIHSHFFI